MSNTTFPGIIQDTEIQDNGVASLRTAPNRGGTWGQNGLTAGDLQKKFDALPTLIAQRLNALITSIEKGTTPESEARREAIALLNDALAAEATARAAEDANKLDKLTGSSTGLYAVLNGEQHLHAFSQDAQPYTMALRTAGGQVKTGNAVLPEAAVPLKQMQDAISTEASARDDAIRTAIANLVNGAPDTLNTLAELADALQRNPDVVATLESAIADKASKKELDQALAGKLDVPTGANHIWSTDQNGNLVYQSWSQSASGKSLVRRTPNGQIKAKEAIADDDAVPLAQMNTALADKASGADLADLVSRVVELEQNGGGGAPSYTDSGVAYEKTVPANALPVAAITEIGGNTIVFKNPINLAPIMALAGQTITDESGWSALYVTFTEDGHIEYTTDSYSYWAEVEIPIKFRQLFPDAELGRSYRISSKQEYVIGERHYSDGYIRPSGLDADSFVLTEDILDRAMVVHPTLYEYLNWYDPETGDEEWMTAAADTTFYDIELVPDGRENDVPYDAKVTQVNVLGTNILPFTPGERVVGGVTVTTDENGVMTFNGTCTSSATISTRIAIKRGRWYILRDFAEGVWPTSGERIRIGENYAEYTRIYTYNDGSLRKSMTRFDKLGVYGQTTIPYIISVKSGHTYENCKLRPMLVQGIVPPTEYAPYTAKSYPIPEEVQSLPAYGLGSPSLPFYNRIIFRDGRAIYEQRVDTNRQPLSPYVETDITDALGWDGFIDVEGGGAITFANEYEDSVPSTVVYQLK